MGRDPQGPRPPAPTEDDEMSRLRSNSANRVAEGSQAAMGLRGPLRAERDGPLGDPSRRHGRPRHLRQLLAESRVPVRGPLGPGLAADAALLAARGAPSKLTPGPAGSWPLDYPTLVQPVLDKHCVSCHQPGTKGEKFDLTRGKSYQAMVSYGSPSLKDVVTARYRGQRSIAGACEARVNAVLKLLKKGHYDVKLAAGDWDRLITWMDTLGQHSGSFSPQQEEELRQLRRGMASLLSE